jgi:multicomponent Na+:H+ antiporter subunit E
MANLARTLAPRILLLAAFWWALAEGSSHGWVFGVVGVLGAAALSLRLAPGRWRMPPFPAVARFVGFFLSRSLAGGLDVARRALSPGSRLRPATLDYPFRLPDGAPRILFSMTLSLLPGTLAAGLGRDAIRVHLLDESLPAERSLAALEDRVAELFELELPRADPGSRP